MVFVLHAEIRNEIAFLDFDNIYGYKFVRVQLRFLDIIRPQCSFCGNLQHVR